MAVGKREEVGYFGAENKEREDEVVDTPVAVAVVDIGDRSYEDADVAFVHSTLVAGPGTRQPPYNVNIPSG